MARSFTARQALEILAEADSLLARGAHLADVCRRLGISHVLYERFLSKYRPEQARRFRSPSELDPRAGTSI
jgi:hypothetical protein